MDSKTIGKIVSTNKETDKVMNGNAVVWEKLVTWEKWSVSYTNVYEEKYIDIYHHTVKGTMDRDLYLRDISFHTKYTINGNGRFEFTGDVSGDVKFTSAYLGTNDRSAYDKYGSKDKDRYDMNALYANNNTYYLIKYKHIEEIRSSYPTAYDCTADLYIAQLKERKANKVNFITTVTAPPNTYPDNGEKSGYWYVKEG